MTECKRLRSREQAIDLHQRQAGLFVDWYARAEEDPYFNAFAYGRKQFAEFLSQWLDARLPKGSEILDVGCGSGPVIRYLRERGYRPVGVEPAQAMRSAALAANPCVQVLDATADALPFENERFHAVFAIEVYRYLDEQDCRAGYEEAFRVLKPGGYFLFTLANRYALHGFPLFYHCKRLLNLVLRRETHYDHFTTPGATKRQLEDQFGDQIEKIETRGLALAFLYPLYKINRKLASRVARALEPLDKWISQHAFSVPFAANLVVVVRKKGNGPH